MPRSPPIKLSQYHRKGALHLSTTVAGKCQDHHSPLVITRSSFNQKNENEILSQSCNQKKGNEILSRSSSPLDPQVILHHLIRRGSQKRNWEISDGPEEPTVAGKMHEKGQFWHQSLKASKFVLDVIDTGSAYLLPSHVRPFQPEITLLVTASAPPRYLTG